MLSHPLPGGPLRLIALEDGQRAPFFLIPFDKEGVCTGPVTRQELVDAVARENPTDVFLFSHGWNNDWDAAIDSYEDFVTGFAQLRALHPIDREFRPVLIGVFWPSVVLVAPWEQAPDIAGAGNGPGPDAELAEVAAVVPAEQRERFCALATQPAGGLNDNEASELAALVATAFAGSDELGTTDSVSAQDVMAVWRATPSGSGQPSWADFNFGDQPVGPGNDPEPAGLGLLDPRVLVRVATVLMMKDRSGRVGASGVAGLLQDILVAGSARVHLVGHSYGCRVILSAMVAAPLSRQVDSVLLLQPATSCLCFASDADGHGTPGGYLPALGRSVQPIMATFSRHDVPLTMFFHVAVRRRADLGDFKIAGAPPSRYAALGGFGPSGIDAETYWVPAVMPPEFYSVPPPKARVVAVELSSMIHGHNDINNDATHWMLLSQTARKDSTWP